MSKSRVVHYVGAARGRTFFPCFGYEQTLAFSHEFDFPLPLRTTSLTKVTCPECWIRIKVMADSAVKRRGVEE